jgi:hypothetical protein
VLELLEMMSRRVNAVLALGTTDHVLPSPTRVICQKRNFPTPTCSWARNFPALSLWQLRYIQSFSIDWRRNVGMCSVIRNSCSYFPIHCTNGLAQEGRG